jgi:hypothetical protein
MVQMKRRDPCRITVAEEPRVETEGTAFRMARPTPLSASPIAGGKRQVGWQLPPESGYVNR